MPMPVAFSPCPNDTYIFHAWVSGLLGKDFPICPVIADVQHLNEWAAKGKYPVTKASMNCLGHILDEYVLLPVGCAIGHSNGPKIIANKMFDLDRINEMRVAIPGADTTANLLFNVLIDPTVDKSYCHYDQVPRLVRSGIVDCGVIIHETRFTFQENGFVEIADLGQLWEGKYSLPLPLGGIVAKRSLGQEVLNDVTRTLQASLQYAMDRPDASLQYVLDHAIEKNRDVIRKHIELFVNQETLSISDRGRAAIAKLLELAREGDFLPACDKDWLFDYESSFKET
ncbi:MAG: 1,4-dihydroxy-6-naphthoate synthase [Chlamydiales bacterium]|nr:1,4-dihydroxy-6-naphthoate synthase [Chlamydiales bacterium]